MSEENPNAIQPRTQNAPHSPEPPHTTTTPPHRPQVFPLGPRAAFAPGRNVTALQGWGVRDVPLPQGFALGSNPLPLWG